VSIQPVVKIAGFSFAKNTFEKSQKPMPETMYKIQLELLVHSILLNSDFPFAEIQNLGVYFNFEPFTE